jgi:hypothetical protein
VAIFVITQIFHDTFLSIFAVDGAGAESSTLGRYWVQLQQLAIVRDAKLLLLVPVPCVYSLSLLLSSSLDAVSPS